MHKPLISRFRIVLLLLLVDYGFLITGAKSVEADVTLTNGQTEQFDVVSAGANGVSVRIGSVPTPQLIPLNRIANIAFPTSDAWNQAEEFHAMGELEKALRAYQAVIKDTRGNFYPAPGNHSSLGILRIIEIHRELGNAEQVANWSSRLKRETLPLQHREAPPIIQCWIEIGQKNWEPAIQLIDAVQLAPTDPGAEELGYLRGLALESSGKPKEAIAAYGSAYSFHFGEQTELAKRSLQAAARLLENLGSENRQAELKGMVHTYAKVYNSGKLWEGASQGAESLLAEELDQPKPPEPPEPKDEGEQEAAPKAPPKEPGKAKKPAAKKK